ncbi:MAG TPA: hypothetical protein VK158_02300 [Acidobacteriota bacterium]|nr:hypothetical protein [Acidobacteriota bacterium]
MEFEVRENYRCTKEGLELLVTRPDFLKVTVNDPVQRQYLFTKGPKVFTKIAGQYIEKTGTDWREFFPYRRMARIVQDDALAHIRVATPLFGNEQSIILPYYSQPYNPSTPGQNPIEPNDEAQEELWDILSTGIPMEFFIEPKGDLIIVDPHA